jgi:hypothetical protein
MSVCYYPVQQKSTSSNNKLERFRIINEINLTYNLDKSVFDKIMQRVLIEFCESTVLGYDRYLDKYWCKKINKGICKLHVEIIVNFKDYDFSEIRIIPLVGINDDIKTFIFDFHESIQIYKTSNFIRDILHGR